MIDDSATVFMLPAMMVEDPNRPSGPNALVLAAGQVEAIVAAIAPEFASRPCEEGATAPPTPQIGLVALATEQIRQVEAELSRNPPQRFDLARVLNVFNAHVEFIELRLTGMQIARHVVKLPQDLVLALRDEATTRRLRTSFNLVDAASKVGRAAESIEARVRDLRERFVRPVGELGAITLRSKRKEIDGLVASIKVDIERFRGTVVSLLGNEIDASRAKLVAGLMPALRNKPPRDLLDQVSSKVSVEHIRRYLDHRLVAVFPRAESLVGEMRLDCVRKGVTYETLAGGDFQQMVREAFPFEDWDKPFAEFEAAAAAAQAALPLT